MTYWSPAPPPHALFTPTSASSSSHSSSYTQAHSQAHIALTMQPTRTVLSALNAFYQEEQYWVHRTRATLKAAALSSSVNDDISSAPPVTMTNEHDIFLSDASADTSESNTPLAVPSRPHSSLSPSPDPAHNIDANWSRRQHRRRTTRDAGVSKVKSRHHKKQPGARMLDAFGALVDARMESCARVARMVEMRECFF